MGEGAGREPGRRHPATAVHAAPGSLRDPDRVGWAAAVQELRRAERLAARSMRRLGQGTAPSRGSRPHDLGNVRGRTVEPDTLCRPVRRLPCRAGPHPEAAGRLGDPGHGLQDLPGSLRHQQILGQGERRRSAGRNPGRKNSIRADRVEFRQDGSVVGEHRRVFGRDQTVFDPAEPAGEGSASAGGHARRRGRGTTCRCWPVNQGHSGMARRSRTGSCRHRSSRCAASSPRPRAVIGKPPHAIRIAWGPRDGRHPERGADRRAHRGRGSPPPQGAGALGTPRTPRRSVTACTRPTSSSTSSPGNASPGRL